MTLNRREKISIGVSVLALAGVWLASSSPSSTPPSTASSSKKQVMVSSPDKMVAVLTALTKTPTASKSDPFAPLSNAPVQEQGNDKTNALFVLQGIFRDEHGKAAILNGVSVYEGAEISPGVVLVQVLDTEVVIKKADGEIHLGFEP